MSIQDPQELASEKPAVDGRAGASKQKTDNAGPAPEIVIVDDEQDMCDLLSEQLSQRGYSVRAFTSAKAALDALPASDASLLLVDLNMDELDGIELCRMALSVRPDLDVIVMTGFGSIELAVRAMRAGAQDFVSKPLSIDMLALTLERALREQSLRGELDRLRQRMQGGELPNIVSSSAAMNRVIDVVHRVARSEASVLITGESGTGKELVARALHERSERTGEFLAINCSAIPENLLESELFGHARGAFTGATHERAGLLSEARKGTLFLDEIAEMPLGMQAKILRALQERKARPVGSSREVEFDARIVTATNRDLEDEVKAGRFREDLYYRINVIRVELPPLRARGSDVLLLAQYFLERAARRNPAARRRLGQAVAERLASYDWPGNVRELENCVERMVALSRTEEITLEDLPAKIREHHPTEVVTLSEDPNDLPSMATVEERYLRKVLAAVGGNKTLAAKILKLDRRTLYRRLAELEASGR
ncbi:MAG TPA: sigma-54 dependent transcriptional regulator [Polyangiaceae bacterium]